MLSRSIQPQLKQVEKIDFLAPLKYELNSHVFLYHMKNVPNETARFDLYFDAGKCRMEKGIPSFVNGLLLSGTNNKSSIQINSEIDGNGGFFESGISVENAVVSMYCLRENLLPIFRTVMDAIENVSFIEKEVNEYLADRKQDLKISMTKVRYLAQKEFQKRLFSNSIMYSSSTEISDLENLSREELIDYHHKHYLKSITKIVLVGNLDEQTVRTIIDLCTPHIQRDEPVHEDQLVSSPGRFSIQKSGALQSAIRIGRLLFNKNHPDYLDFLILNTILGDYFGSRLMSNIREDKGYTYGIGSALAELNSTGYFVIATEVGADVKDKALDEIKLELERLRNELVSEEELSLVKNYMLGQLLKSADGPYAMTDLFLSTEMHGKGLEFYNEALHAIKNITPTRIRDLAREYLAWEELTIVTAG